MRLDGFRPEWYQAPPKRVERAGAIAHDDDGRILDRNQIEILAQPFKAWRLSFRTEKGQIVVRVGLVAASAHWASMSRRMSAVSHPCRHSRACAESPRKTEVSRGRGGRSVQSKRSFMALGSCHLSRALALVGSGHPGSIGLPRCCDRLWACSACHFA